MTVCDNTTQVRGLIDFFKSLVIKRLHLPKNLAKIVQKVRGKALKIGTNVGTAFASRSHKTPLSSLPEVMNF